MIGLGILAPTAVAQHRLLRPQIGKKFDPTLNGHHHKKFRAPILCGEACFGYFPTQWATWEQLCPTGTGCDVPVIGVPLATPGTVVPAEPGAPPATPVETAPKPAESTPPKTPPMATPGKPESPPAKEGDKPKSDTNALRRRVVPPGPKQVVPAQSTDSHGQRRGQPVSSFLLPPPAGGQR
jgi:hypothetical protein